MVNKDVLFQTFMKLESYDRVNIMSELLKFSSSFELEFYSSIINSILQYQKVSFDTLKEELNHDDNILLFKNTESIDSSMRSKLISTISLLKVSNVSGATRIFEFLRKNYDKFKELAHNSPNAYEEILLIYQLANDHPAFSFNHCKEIYDYLKEIKAIPVVKEYTEIQIRDELLNDLNVASIEKNDQQQYVYRIKVKWDRFECCINRTLEDVYKFYSKLYQMFTAETKTGEICPLYLSFSDNLDLSKALMSRFLKDFMNSPQHVLRCDYVREFFKPKSTDKHICDCELCRKNFNKLMLSQDQRFDNISNCSSPNNPSDNEDYIQSFDTKTEISYSHSNFSSNSIIPAKTLLGVSVDNHHLGSDDGSDLSMKPIRNKNHLFHSSGSSPINTPSDESEICTKNSNSNHHSTDAYRKFNKEIKSDISSTKDLRTENWICQTRLDKSNPSSNRNNTVLHNQPYINKSDLEGSEQNNLFEDVQLSTIRDMEQFYSYQIGNLLDWLKQTRLHKYYSYIQHLNFGEFHNLTEDKLNSFGFVDGASKKLISLIRDLTSTNIEISKHNIVNLISRNRSNSNDSSRSFHGSYNNISDHKSDLIHDFNGQKSIVQSSPNFTPQIFCQPFMSNLIILPSNFLHNSNIYSVAQNKHSTNTNS